MIRPGRRIHKDEQQSGLSCKPNRMVQAECDGRSVCDIVRFGNAGEFEFGRYSALDLFLWSTATAGEKSLDLSW